MLSHVQRRLLCLLIHHPVNRSYKFRPVSQDLASGGSPWYTGPRQRPCALLPRASPAGIRLFTQGLASGRQWCPVHPGGICAPLSHVWPSSCCIHPILYLKNVPPPLVAFDTPLFFFFYSNQQGDVAKLKRVFRNESWYRPSSFSMKLSAIDLQRHVVVTYVCGME